jgi:hypothetical protein
MKKHLLYLSLILVATASIYSLTIDTTNAHASGGSSIAGCSGSPSDGGTCLGCHGSYSMKAAPAKWITSNVPAAGYTPGTTYTITCRAISTISGQNSNFGFEITPQNASGGVVGTLANLVTSGKGSTTIASGEWVTQTSSSYTGTDSCVWSFAWTAPNPGVGAVNFYANFNCGSGDNSGSAQIYQDSLHYIQSNNPPPPCNHYYATLPYSTSFENTWVMDSCTNGAQRQPDMYWKSSIGGTTPDGDDYWHRDDYTGTDWTSPTSGAFTPTAQSGSYSARFHNSPPPAGSTGSLDLYVNLSPAGTKTISFYYLHNEASVSPFAFTVLLSTDGGKTFPTTLLTIGSTTVSAWTLETVTTTATSATSVIRFMVTDKGNMDVGIDNLSVMTSPTGMDELSANEGLTVYPNPTDGSILNGHFDNNADNIMDVSIYDMMGREVFTKQINVEAGNFSLSFPNGQLKTGIYLFAGTTKNGRVTKTIVVK